MISVNLIKAGFGITNHDSLEKELKQNALLDFENSTQGIEKTSDFELPSNLYFGVGITNGGKDHKLSQGVPIDVLSMILFSEMLGKDKNVLVADIHARTNGFSDEEINKVANHYQTTFRKIVDNLDLKNWSIDLASELVEKSSYQDCLSQISHENNYVKHELADMLFYSRERDVNLKVGWAMKSGSRNSDELAFDNLFKEQTTKDLAFLYVVPGTTMDPKRMRAPHYFCKEPEARILIQPAEDVDLKIDDARGLFGNQGVKTYLNSMKQLVRMYEKVIAPLERGTVQEKMTQIIERCTR